MNDLLNLDSTLSVRLRYLYFPLIKASAAYLHINLCSGRNPPPAKAVVIFYSVKLNNVQNWWRVHRSTFLLMAEATRDYLSILAPEVSVLQRLFNAGKDALGDRRHVFQGETMRVLMLFGDVYNLYDSYGTIPLRSNFVKQCKLSTAR